VFLRVLCVLVVQKTKIVDAKGRGLANTGPLFERIFWR